MFWQIFSSSGNVHVHTLYYFLSCSESVRRSLNIPLVSEPSLGGRQSGKQNNGTLVYERIMG